MYKKLKLVESTKLNEIEKNIKTEVLELDGAQFEIEVDVTDKPEIRKIYFTDDEGSTEFMYDEVNDKFTAFANHNFLTSEQEEALKEKIKTILNGSSLTEATDEEEEVEETIDRVEDDIEATEELEDTIDSEEDQEENPVEEESELDAKLDELREVLVDLDLNLYRVASKEDPNNVIYVIGKVAEESNDTLLLIDTKPEEVNDIEIEKPIIDEVEPTEAEEEIVEPEEEVLETPEQRFDFIVIPKSFDEINKINPRYGEDITPDHEAIMDYLMNCLIEINPKAAEELQKEEEPSEEVPVPVEDDLEDIGIEIEDEEDLEDEN